MRTSEHGIQFIAYYEGFSPTVYICPAGIPTIGYGHTIREGESFTRITKEEAENLLRRDIAIYEKSVSRLIIVPLTQGQFDALVSFSYNLGSGALQRSTLRAKLNRQEYHDAADEFLKWIWVGGRKLKGLMARRAAERQIFLS